MKILLTIIRLPHFYFTNHLKNVY